MGLLENGEKEDAISAINVLTDTLNKLKKEIISVFIASGAEVPINFADPKLEKAIT
jgi:hypothetical protein